MVHPSVYIKQQENRQRHKGRRVLFMLGFFVTSIVGYVIMAYQVEPTYTLARSYTPRLAAEEQQISWPTEGSAAVSYVGATRSVLASNNGQDVRPVASTIKVLTVLTVLDKKPLSAKESGERIYFDANDEQIYSRILAEDGVVFPIRVGASISYHQAIELVLIGSANNIAEKLALWAFGDMDTYKAAASDYLKKHELNSTTVADASGLSSLSTSTAEDMLRLSLLAVATPVVSEVTNLEKVEINGVTVVNTNPLVGFSDGVRGIKTGYTPEAGNCLLFSKTVNGYEYVVVLMGIADRGDLFSEASRLVSLIEAQTTTEPLVKSGSTVADLTSPWGEEVGLIASNDLQVFRWKGESTEAEVMVEPTGYVTRKTVVGEVRYGENTAQLIPANDLPTAPLSWRLRHGFDYLKEIL